MRLRLGLILALLAATRLTPALVCAPTTLLERQFCSGMKHRAQGPRLGAETTASQLMAWPPPTGVADIAVRRRDSPIDPRDERVVVLESDLWRVKVEDNDGDLDWVAGAPGRGEERRIIAEAE